MIKVVSLIRRHPDLSPAEFKRYWQEVHAPLVRERLPGMIRYTGSFPLADAHGSVPIGAMDYDAVVEIGFPDKATMDANMTSPEFLADDRQKSSAHFMDADGSKAIVVEEIDAL